MEFLPATFAELAEHLKTHTLRVDLEVREHELKGENGNYIVTTDCLPEIETLSLERAVLEFINLAGFYERK